MLMPSSEALIGEGLFRNLFPGRHLPGLLERLHANTPDG